MSLRTNADWIRDAIEAFEADPLHLNVCEVHDSHESLNKHIVLRGPCEAVPDYPPIPDQHACEFDLVVYDWSKYDGVPMYCSGNDSVSQAVDTQGVWEGFETLLALAILNEEDRDDLFIDLGSHVGWYTMLAATRGYEVLSVDADKENLGRLRLASILNGVSEHVHTAHGWIGSNVPVLEPIAPNIQLLKADVEGAEDEVLRIFSRVLEERAVKYAFFEISPEFSDHYPDTVQQVLDYGYSAYFIPDKGTSTELFAADPLGYTMNPVSRVTKQDVAGLRIQRNAIFVRN